MHFLSKLAVTTALAVTANFANATIVTSNTFDGMFSTNLSGVDLGGAYGIKATFAYDGSGQNHEYISFDKSVKFSSLSFSQYGALSGAITVSLFNDMDALLASKTLASLTDKAETLSFDTDNVKKAIISFSGDKAYDGHLDSWYWIKDITYHPKPVPGTEPVPGTGTAEVPEPASLALFGLALAGCAAARRKRATRTA